MVTIKDIAKKLGISISTVSKGLNGASDISEEMRQQVLDTALSMGYIMKNKKSPVSNHKKVCIMVENMDYENINQFGYEIITGFRLAATKHHYEVDVIPMDVYTQSQQSYDTFMKENQYHGAFFLGFELTDAYLGQLHHTNVPTLLFDNWVSNPNVGCIGTDNDSAFAELIALLHRQGHERIALLNGVSHSHISRLRLAAYEKALEAEGLPYIPELTGFGTFDPEAAKEFVPLFLENGATAICCASDLIASGVIQELHRLGRLVPENISVTGFDDLPVAKYLAPPLTTIRQERFTLGKAAFGQLRNLIHHIPISTMLLRGNLIERESTRDIKA